MILSDHHLTLTRPARLRVADLDLGGQFVLCAVRNWTQPQAAPADDTQRLPLCSLFRLAGLDQASLAGFATLLGLIGSVPLHTGPLHNPLLSGDEAALLASICALQAGAPWRAQTIVAGWLPPSLMPRAIGLMACFARDLARAGLPVAAGPASHQPTLH